MPDLPHDHIASLGHLTDEDLWEAFKTGDRQAFNHIYRQYSAQLYNYGRQISGSHEQVKDAIQDMFVSLWQNKESLGKTDAIKYYLFTSLRRRIIENKEKYKKAAIRQYRYEEEDTVRIVFPFDESIIQEESAGLWKKNLKQTLNSLSSRQKEVLFLLYYQNMSYEAIGELMGIHTRSVYTLAWKATEALRKKIQQLSPLLFAVAFLLGLLCAF